jgi:hypothetical protein
VDDILKLIVTVTANVMDSKICPLWILDEKEKAFKIRVTQTMSEAYLKKRVLKLGEGDGRPCRPDKTIAGHSGHSEKTFLQREGARPQRRAGLDAERPLEGKR